MFMIMIMIMIIVVVIVIINITLRKARIFVLFWLAEIHFHHLYGVTVATMMFVQSVYVNPRKIKIEICMITFLNSAQKKEQGAH